MATNHEEFKQRILERIKQQDVTMRPKMYFTLRLVALFVVALAALLISVFILNFILFSIRINSHDMLLGFGPRGFGAFLRFFPWPLLIADVALIFLLQSLVRHFRFGYRMPVLYLFLGLIAVTLAVGTTLDRGTHFNDDVLSRADRHELFEPFDELYEHARFHVPPGTGICRCQILSIEGNTLIMRDTRSTTTVTVTLSADNPHATTTGLKMGDTVFVAGDVDDGVIHAFGIHVLPQAPVPPVPPQP